MRAITSDDIKKTQEYLAKLAEEERGLRGGYSTRELVKLVHQKTLKQLAEGKSE